MEYLEICYLPLKAPFKQMKYLKMCYIGFNLSNEMHYILLIEPIEVKFLAV